MIKDNGAEVQERVVDGGYRLLEKLAQRQFRRNVFRKAQAREGTETFRRIPYDADKTSFAATSA